MLNIFGLIEVEVAHVLLNDGSLHQICLSGQRIGTGLPKEMFYLSRNIELPHPFPQLPLSFSNMWIGTIYLLIFTKDFVAWLHWIRTIFFSRPNKGIGLGSDAKGQGFYALCIKGIKALINQPELGLIRPSLVAVEERIPLWNRILPTLVFGNQASWKIRILLPSPILQRPFLSIRFFERRMIFHANYPVADFASNIKDL